MAKQIKDWGKARALFESGKSNREVSAHTGIPYKTIEYRAKKEGWNRGEIAHTILEAVRVAEDIAQLNPAQQKIVKEQVGSKLTLLGFRDNFAEKAMERVIDRIGLCEDRDIKSIVEAADKVCIMAEIAPRFNPNTAIINNTNAQQNNEKVIRVEHSPTIADV
jgi:hypothetical protein